MLSSAPKLKEYDQLGSLMVMLTRACQLACVYCVYDRRRPAMSPRDLERSIDLLFTAECDPVRLQFFGGEPLLRLDLLLRGIRYAEKLRRASGRSVRYTVTTNGLLLDRRVLDRLAPYGADYLVSFDGGRAAQEAQRPLLKKGGTYPYRRILDNISGLVRSGHDFFVNMVTSPESVADVERNAGLLLELGVRKLRFAYRMGALWRKGAAADYFSRIGRLLRRLRREGRAVSVFNPLCMDEPDIMSPTPTVDCDGRVYLGSVVPALEELLPPLKGVCDAGALDTVRRMQDLRQDRRRLWNRFLGACAGDPARLAVVRSNLQMGLLSDAFFDRMQGLGLTGGGDAAA